MHHRRGRCSPADAGGPALRAVVHGPKLQPFAGSIQDVENMEDLDWILDEATLLTAPVYVPPTGNKTAAPQVR